jgi:ribosomal protein L11 methyltransferase
MNKPLWKISVSTTLEAEDAVAEMLGKIFNGTASSFFDFEKRTSRVAIFVPDKIPTPTREQLRIGLNEIKNCGLNIGPGEISISKVRREDWAESWKRHFKPIEIGKKLLVKPSWSKKRPRKEQAVVVLDPGLSFGTGQHPTTMYCLEEVVRNFKPGRSFLDIGTGSGILAIAATRLRYRHISAMDFDPEAVRVARANARANGVKIQIIQQDVSKMPIKRSKGFDLICANLISNLLIAERRRIVAQLNPGGVLVLAGILKSEFFEVEQMFENLGLKLLRSRSKKEWKSGSFCFE